MNDKKDAQRDLRDKLQISRNVELFARTVSDLRLEADAMFARFCLQNALAED